MGKDSSIQWTDHTFNGVRGCVERSAGCDHCYARTMSLRNPKTLGVWGTELNGTRVVASEAMWKAPLKWDRDAKAAGERHRVFAYSLGDVFEDWQGPMLDAKGERLYSHIDVNASAIDGSVGLTMDGVRANLLQLIFKTPNLDWLLLTKRPENIRKCLIKASDHFKPSSPERKAMTQWLHYQNPPENVWLGTTTENQEQAGLRIPHLVKIPAAVRFLSAEPLLGPINLKANTIRPAGQVYPRVVPDTWSSGMIYGIHWLIVGGESGGKARPFDLAWARSLRDQCKAAGAAYFLKQLGARPVFSDHVPVALQGSVEPGSVIGFPTNDSHGGDWDEWPADLRVREFPAKETT